MISSSNDNLPQKHNSIQIWTDILKRSEIKIKNPGVVVKGLPENIFYNGKQIYFLKNKNIVRARKVP